jgi:hypothetical protein
MRPLLFLFIFCLSSLQASQGKLFQNDDSIVVNSGDIQYDGKEFVLVGEVVVEHSLGKISAHRLSFESMRDNDKKNRFGLLKISEDVQIELYSSPDGHSKEMPESLEKRGVSMKGGGQLNCQKAEIDYANMRGNFLGNEASPDVSYRHSKVAENGQERPSVEIKSSRMNLQFIKDPIASKPPLKALVKEIEADGNVRIFYGQDYLLFADHALYSLEGANKVLTLTPRGERSTCRVTSFNGGCLDASVIQLRVVDQVLVFSDPVGTFPLNREGDPVQALKMNAKELIWDDREQNLHFKGDKNHQVFIEDALGELYADTVFIKYASENSRLVPLKMTLKGHVRLINRFDGHIEESGSILHYAVADYVEYMLGPQEVLLLGEDGNRVLFFDVVKNIQMSAPGLKVKHNLSNKEKKGSPQGMSIQGMGDVRFTFIEKELDQLKSHFPLGDTSRKEAHVEASDTK